MQIKTVSIIGLGALGVMYGHHLAGRMPRENLRIIADAERRDKYLKEKIYSNGEICDFHYTLPSEEVEYADLLIFSVKFGALKDAIKAAYRHVGPDTIILSLLNGISSEEVIAREYRDSKIVYSVAQGMDALKIGNRLVYHNMGLICFGGNVTAKSQPEHIEAVRAFFERTDIPHIVDNDMKKRMWGKFMLNVGVNQAVTLYQSDYGSIQKEGEARQVMISAMREVLTLSEKEGVNLTNSDLEYWLEVLNGVDSKGMPSMRQDHIAKRKSEVELFAGTVLALAKKHDIDCPTNKMLYRKIKEAENNF